MEPSLVLLNWYSKSEKSIKIKIRFKIPGQMDISSSIPFYKRSKYNIFFISLDCIDAVS